MSENSPIGAYKRQHARLKLRAISWFAMASILAISALPGHHTVAQTPSADQPLPKAEAPFGLGDVRLPESQFQIAEIFRRLPPNVAGESLSVGPHVEFGNRRVIVAYGEDISQLMPCIAMAAFDAPTIMVDSPYLNGADVIVRGLPGAPLNENGFGVIVQAGGLDGNLAWMSYIEYDYLASFDTEKPRRPPIPQPQYMYRWAVLGSPWSFVAGAPTQVAVDALMRAFVAASSNKPMPTPLPDSHGELCKFQVPTSGTPISG
jgi:hypothetical protein